MKSPLPNEKVFSLLKLLFELILFLRIFDIICVTSLITFSGETINKSYLDNLMLSILAPSAFVLAPGLAMRNLG